MPYHLIDTLSEDMLIENWLLIKLRSRCAARSTTRRDVGPLRAHKWLPDPRNGPMLWESQQVGAWRNDNPIPFGVAARRLAAIGIVQYGHLTVSKTGAWMSWPQLCAHYGGTLKDGLDRDAQRQPTSTSQRRHNREQHTTQPMGVRIRVTLIK